MHRDTIIVRLPNWLGDIVMCLPFLERLLEKEANHRFYFIVKSQYQEIFKIKILSAKIIIFDKKEYESIWGLLKFRKTFPELINASSYYTLAPSFSSALMGRILGVKRIIGHNTDYRSLLLHVKINLNRSEHRIQQYFDLISEKFENLVIQPELKCDPIIGNRYIVLNVNSEASSRRLPNVEWAKVIERIPTTHKLVFIGHEKDGDHVKSTLNFLDLGIDRYVDLSGKTNLVELANVLKYADAVVSNDSGPAHLAAILGTSVSVFFGAGNRLETGPFGKQVRIYSKSIHCSPCLKNICRYKNVDCLRDIEPINLK
ncbi:glycosyltransferase family 9 protein [Bacteriovoracaceae bacterium]|nr:glycosyltransferase family 9 protein [Bacteriovoracaceae bacterium]